MRTLALLGVTLVALAAGVSARPNAQVVYITLAFCPTDFTSKGAVVSVDTLTGAYRVVNTFDWPKEIFGCPALYDPTVFFDNDNGLLYLDFTSDVGWFTTVDVRQGVVKHSAKPDDMFWTGYENFFVQKHGTANVLQGLSANVEQEGYCDDGCFQYVEMSEAGHVTRLSDIPFKAILDDSHYYDAKTDVMWVQGSYDLREESERCSKDDADDCLLAIDGSTGKLINATRANDWTVYKYAQQVRGNGDILGFVYGFEGQCKHPYEDFAFATVNLASANATLVACMQHNTTLGTEEWLSTFAPDDALMVHASGNSETGRLQVLVLETKTGRTVLDSSLEGLPQALGAAEGLLYFWSVDFA